MKVLVVEDEHRIGMAIKKGLEQERFTVDVAYSGVDGLDLATSGEYDLILLDLMLPGMDGVTLCKEVRNKHIHTPILMLTAKGQTENKVEGLNAGADDYLTKPFAFEELLARVRALTRRPTQAMNSILIVDGLTLNTMTYIAERGGVIIQLSSKEFSLLEYLMRHAHMICSKDQIITHVWNYDADILPNTVEVYIRNLRNKIDHPFRNKKPLLHTVRGFGYRIGE